MTKEESILIDKVKKGSKEAFRILFDNYYNELCFVALSILKDKTEAEETIQALFVKIWEERDKLNITSSLKAYLKTSVRNRCHNVLSRQKVRLNHAQAHITENRGTFNNMSFSDPYLMEKIHSTIDSLPLKRKKIFKLNRIQGYKYREIAEELNISQKTVEAQMAKAMQTMRQELKEYLSILLIYLCI